MAGIYKNEKARNLYLEFYDTILKQWPVPYESIFVDTTYGRIHLIHCGKKGKPPLFLIHGGGTNSLMWITMVEYFTDDFEVFAIDNPDQPNKSVGNKPFDKIDDYMMLLKEILDGLLIPKAFFLGLSQGGWLSLNFPLYFPDRVLKTVVMCPMFGLYPTNTRFFKAFLRIALFPTKKRITRFLSKLSYKNMAEDDLITVFVDMILKMLKCYKMPKTMMKHPVLSDDELEQIRCPIMVLIGEDEIIYDNPDDVLERVTKNIPQASVKKIPHCGHTIQYDQPDMASAYVKDFLLK